MKSEWFKRWDDEETVDDYWAATREDGDVVEEEDTGWKKRKSSGSSWWSTFHGSGSKKSSYTPVKSTSAYLRSSYSNWYSSTSRRSDRDDLLEVLKEVNKTINLTQNSADGKSESNMTVRYSNGHCNNDLMSDILYISPNVIRDENGDVISKESDDYYNGLDALNGQAMLCSFMRKSVSPIANAQYTTCDNWAIRNLYMTDLQTTAGNEICSDWPGFRSYIEQQQQVFQMKKEEVLAAFQDPNQNIDNFVNLLCYNRLSTDRIDYRDHFDENIAGRLESADHYLNSTMDQPWHNDGRFDRASEMFSSIQRMLSLDEPPPPPPPPPGGEGEENPESGEDKNDPQGGEGDGEGDSQSEDQGEGEGEGEEENNGEGGESQNDSANGSGKIKVDNIDTNSGSSRDRRFTGDNSYNGQVVENENMEDAEIDPNEKIKDKTKKEQDKLQNIEDQQLKDVVYNKIVPAVNDYERNEYKSFVATNRRAINAVKDCFQFHNTDVGLLSHGLTSGNIDENSMFKVYMGESDRLYERRDVLTRKKWLVSILIDQSGSMNDPCRTTNGRSSTLQRQASELAIIFSEALKSLADLDFSIYGFSTNYSQIDTFVYKDKTVNKLEALIEADSHEGTGIGFHVGYVGDKIISQYGEYDNKILFVITDGMPNATPTPTMSGVEHTYHCCNLLRKRGIHVYGIGVANAFDKAQGDRLFGPGQHVTINDVGGTLNVLVNRVRNFLQRMRK
jgi:hypothetical protein